MRGFSREKLHFTFSAKEGNVEKKEGAESVPLSPEIEYLLHKTSMGKLLSSIIESPEGTAIKRKGGKNFPQNMLLLKAEGLIKIDEGKLKPCFQIKDRKVPKLILEKLEEIFFKIPDGKILREIEEKPGILTSKLASKLSMELGYSEAFVKTSLRKMEDFGLITREKARGRGGQLANFPKEKGRESHPES